MQAKLFISASPDFVSEGIISGDYNLLRGKKNINVTFLSRHFVLHRDFSDALSLTYNAYAFQRSDLREHSKRFILYKKMSRVIGTLILVTMCGVAVGAAGGQQAGEDKKLTLELKSIALKGFDLSKKTADGVATVEVKNPGGAFKLIDVNYRLKLNDHQVAAGKYEKELEIPATGEVTLELPFTVDITSIPGVAWNTITDSLTLRYEFETEFTIPLFASLKHRQQSSFKGDLPVGEAFASLSNRLKEKLFGKP